MEQAKRDEWFKKVWNWGTALIAVSILVFYGFKYLKETYTADMLREKSTKEVPAIVKTIEAPSIHSPAAGVLSYTINGKEYELTDRADYTGYHVGDTVLVRYSTEDYGVVEVVDRHYMQKYH